MSIIYSLLKFLYLRIWAENTVLNDYILHLGQFLEQISQLASAQSFGHFNTWIQIASELPCTGELSAMYE